MQNIFTNTADVAVAIVATIIAFLVDSYGMVILLGFLVGLLIVGKAQYKIYALIGIALIFKLESDTWPALATSLWIGAASNLVWEAGLYALLTKVTGVQFPQKAPGMLNWIVAAIAFWVQVKVDDFIDWFLYLEWWQMALAILCLIILVVVMVLGCAFVYSRFSPASAPATEEEDDYDFFS